MMIICAELSTRFLCFFSVADSKMSELETDVSSRAIWYRSAVCDCSDVLFVTPGFTPGDRRSGPGSARPSSHWAIAHIGPVLPTRHPSRCVVSARFCVFGLAPGRPRVKLVVVSPRREIISEPAVVSIDCHHVRNWSFPSKRLPLSTVSQHF